ncbi:TadE/TadG family type IV pilus assembly protein [Vibrio breoganii]|uniref:TadE/TadG family type IV pilus assembly protein n=1 Tax=Vibrio breoganii TaxID=553239 RepID=UPI000C85C5C0|nr:TadE/TadG family type IV pilus assembly protein [Vibrio breoganii]PMG05641.1 hypothetical protein BCV00_12625 [Vibrio breoganii]
MQYVSMKSKKQSGLVVILFTLSLVVLLGFAALAVDLSHLVLNKSRVQNGVDSAALSASVAIENGGGLSDAAKAAIETIELMASSSGNDELNISSQNITPSEVSGAQGAQYQATYTDGTYIDIFFSNDPTEFSNQSVNLGRDIYTRVSIDNHTLDSFLIQIFGLSKSVSASAVSGRSSTLVATSNIAPIGVCDQSGTSSSPWGYSVETRYQIAGKADDSLPNGGDIGPGNFNYLSLDGFGTGANYEGLAGAMGGNPPDENELTETAPGRYWVGRTILTKPGANNSISEAVNTRFDDTSGYPDSDNVKDEDIDYSEYLNRDDRNGRRLVTVPVLDCSGILNGRDDATILGFACFFITNRYVKQGNAEYSKVVLGEFFTEGCTVPNGGGGLSPSDTGPYKIQLYRDPVRGDA